MSKEIVRINRVALRRKLKETTLTYKALVLLDAMNYSQAHMNVNADQVWGDMLDGLIDMETQRSSIINIYNMVQLLDSSMDTMMSRYDYKEIGEFLNDLDKLWPEAKTATESIVTRPIMGTHSARYTQWLYMLDNSPIIKMLRNVVSSAGVLSVFLFYWRARKYKTSSYTGVMDSVWEEHETKQQAVERSLDRVTISRECKDILSSRHTNLILERVGKGYAVYVFPEPKLNRDGDIQYDKHSITMKHMLFTGEEISEMAEDVRRYLDDQNMVITISEFLDRVDKLIKSKIKNTDFIIE